jgi:hypothetical protein
MVAPADEVNDADRLEQEMPAARDGREHHRIPPDAPDADVLEQELPLLEEEGGTEGLDAERTEPVADEERASTSSGG